MAFFESTNTQDDGLNHIVANCNKMALVSTYTPGQSYAATVAAILAEATMASGDFALATVGVNRTLTVTGKTDTAANASGTATHVVLLDTLTSEVMLATEDGAGQSITVGNPVAIAGFVYSRTQPIVAA